ncbi:unnamed protein product [Scytosiphon promiscuus]
MDDVTCSYGQEKMASEIRNTDYADGGDLTRTSPTMCELPRVTLSQQLGATVPTRSISTVPSYRTAVRHVGGSEAPAPSYRTAVRQKNIDGSSSVLQESSCSAVDRASDDQNMHPWATSDDARRKSISDSDATTAIWPPLRVVEEDRGKATAVWAFLLVAFVGYVVYLSLNSVDSRKNPPVQIIRKEEPFSLPDVVFCPAPGDGCDSDDGIDCLPMNWAMSALEGLLNCDHHFASPATPSPTSPAPSESPQATTSGSSATDGSSYFYRDGDDEYRSGSIVAPDPSTPSPVALPAIRVSVETRAHEWCPRVPLSECAIDYDGIESGDVRSLHASFYVLWEDAVSVDPVASTRRFINMFFVDEGELVTDAVVAARLPYDRVSIYGTNPFMFSSNDVVLRMSQYVHLNLNGETGSTERTYTQATTTAQHTLRLEAFDGQLYEGALLYVTLSVNDFTFQSVEEVDPVDWWALLGSVGGVWEIVCVTFGVFFVAHQAAGPDRKWSWTRAIGGGKESSGARRRRPGFCQKCSCGKR